MDSLTKDVIGVIVGYLDHDSTSDLFMSYKLEEKNNLAINVLQCALLKLHKESQVVKRRLAVLSIELDDLDKLSDGLK